jgi:hypothetical protein
MVPASGGPPPVIAQARSPVRTARSVTPIRKLLRLLSRTANGWSGELGARRHQDLSRGAKIYFPGLREGRGALDGRPAAPVSGSGRFGCGALSASAMPRNLPAAFSSFSIELSSI